MRTLIFFFFNDTATTEIYTLSLHDALPILRGGPGRQGGQPVPGPGPGGRPGQGQGRSEEHTSELQSRPHLVCRLLLEKKNKITISSCITINFLITLLLASQFLSVTLHCSPS